MSYFRFFRFTVKSGDRHRILGRIHADMAGAKSCRTRMMYIHLCDMAISLFSKTYFKSNFFNNFLSLSKDKVANVRLKLCDLLPKVKSLLILPSDKGHLLKLENTVKAMLETESDKDVQYVLHKAVQELDKTETGVDGVPSMNLEDDRDNERKLREEQLIASMEDQIQLTGGHSSSNNGSDSDHNRSSQ